MLKFREKFGIIDAVMWIPTPFPQQSSSTFSGIVTHAPRFQEGLMTDQ